MIRARIYKPEKAATQAGRRKTKSWILEFDPERKRMVDPLTGWMGSDDMRSQVRMEFPSCETAEAYARRKGMDYEIRTASENPSAAKSSKSYADNFASNRRGLWTH